MQENLDWMGNFSDGLNKTNMALGVGLLSGQGINKGLVYAGKGFGKAAAKNVLKRQLGSAASAKLASQVTLRGSAVLAKSLGPVSVVLTVAGIAAGAYNMAVIEPEIDEFRKEIQLTRDAIAEGNRLKAKYVQALKEHEEARSGYLEAIKDLNKAIFLRELRLQHDKKTLKLLKKLCKESDEANKDEILKKVRDIKF